MKISRLEVKDILSLGDVGLDFGNNGLVLVDGWNHDDNKANGAGKSAIFNALSFALYGKVPRKITASEILRDGAKSGFALVEVVARNGDVWQVKRGRPSSCVFWRNSNPVDIAQEEFESAIGLTYGQFLVSMYTAQVEGRKFIDLNDSGKKEFLLQLLNMEDFQAGKKLIDGQIKTLEQEIGKLNGTIDTSKARIAAYNESIVEPDDIHMGLSTNLAKIATGTKAIKQLELVKRPDTTQFDDLEAKIKTKQTKIHEASAQRSAKKDVFRRLQQDLVALDGTKIHPDAACPHCDKGINIVGRSLKKADDATSIAASVEEKKIDLENQLAALKEEIDTYDQVVSQRDEIQKIENKLRQKRSEAQVEYQSALQQIAELKSKIALLTANNKTLQEKLDANEAIQEKISQVEAQVNKAQKVIAAKTDELEILKTVSQMCAPTGAPAYIMDAVIDSFNEEVSEYVAMLWPNANYTLRSFKENSDGESVAKFSEELIINGKSKSIGSLSGGERRCLSLAVDFALIAVLDKRYSMALNPIIMDEPFEGLDSSSREQVIELLEKLAANRQIWVVDHASEAKAMFSKTVRVEKHNGVSTLA